MGKIVCLGKPNHIGEGAVVGGWQWEGQEGWGLVPPVGGGRAWAGGHQEVRAFSLDCSHFLRMNHTPVS